MTAEGNNVIPIATLGDWLKNVVPVFPAMRTEQNQNQAHLVHVIFSCPLSG